MSGKYFPAFLQPCRYQNSWKYIRGKFFGSSGVNDVNKYFAYWFFIGTYKWFCNNYCTKFGEKNENEIKKAAAGTIFLGFLTAVSITAISLFFLDEILNILNVSDILYVESKGYIKAILLGMTATMFYNAFAGILRAVGDTAAPLIFLVVSCLLNIFLDLYFLSILKTGTSGAAWATVISQGFSVILCFIYMWKNIQCSE